MNELTDKEREFLKKNYFDPDFYEKMEDLYCPYCGKKDKIYRDVGEGDVELGPTWVCLNCSNSYSLN